MKAEFQAGDKVRVKKSELDTLPEDQRKRFSTEMTVEWIDTHGWVHVKERTEWFKSRILELSYPEVVIKDITGEEIEKMICETS